MAEVQITIHEIATEGLPDMGALTGRVAFIFDGCVISGWPLEEQEDDETLWEGDSDVAHNAKFYGVTHWVEFPVPVWELSR